MDEINYGDFEGEDFENTDPSMTQLHGQTLDLSAIMAELEEFDKPQTFEKKPQHIFTEGRYITEPPGKYNMRENFDKMTVANYYPIIAGNGQRDRFGFELCSTKYVAEKLNKTAPCYINYLRACVAFNQVNGRLPVNDTEVFDFVAKNPIDLRLVVSKSNRNFIVDLKAAAAKPVEVIE